jgi:hypothetical protein
MVGFVALAKVESGADGLERLHVPARPALQRREDGVQDSNPPLQGLVVRAVGDFAKPLNLTSSPSSRIGRGILAPLPYSRQDLAVAHDPPDLVLFLECNDA